MIDWNIQSRAHACQACQRPFVDKQSFHTLLFDRRHDYERLDICEECWKAQYSQGATDRKGFISYWQSVYNVPPPAPPDPIQKETAESLLRKLMELNLPEQAAARFILAVMLERKRLLKVKAQLTENQQRVFIYEHVKSGDLFNVPDPNLQLDRLEEVQREVALLLEHGVPNAPSPDGQPGNPENAAQPEPPDSATTAAEMNEPVPSS